MAKFFVGQRVRVNCPSSENHGDETVVIAVGVIGEEFGRLYVGSRVDIRCHTSSTAKYCVFEDHELEPILPEGHQPVEMSKLLTEFPELEQVLGVSA